MIERFGFDGSSQVVEIASNDGYLLQYFVRARRAGARASSRRPTSPRWPSARGIPTLVEFFGGETAPRAWPASTRADLLLGNNVLAHVPDLNDFVGGMKILLKPGGVITMEFPHLMRLIDENQFDTIYHEHFSYLSFTTARRVFAAHGLRLFDVEELPTHGGSLRIYGCHDDDAAKPDGERARELLDARGRRGLLASSSTYLDFGERRRGGQARGSVEPLIELKDEGKRIVGYGAPAKGNTLLNYCGVGRDFLDYTVDLNPHKQGHLLPGTHIPIRAPEAIARGPARRRAASCPGTSRTRSSSSSRTSASGAARSRCARRS